MSMVASIDRAASLARRGLSASQIKIPGLSPSTIEAIVKQHGPPKIERRNQGADVVKLYRIITPRLWKSSTLHAVIERVCHNHGLTRSELLGSNRQRRIAWARHELMYSAAVETNLSIAEIGRRICKDHTTVLHGIARYRQRHGLPHPRKADACQ